MAKWTGTLACVVIVGAAALCLIWTQVLVVGEWCEVGLRHGAVVVVTGDSVPGPLRMLVGPRQTDLEGWKHYGSRPYFIPSRGSTLVAAPLWMLFVVFVIPTVLLWYFDCRSFAPGSCAKCGYNLAGNVSGQCPECGSASP